MAGTPVFGRPTLPNIAASGVVGASGGDAGTAGVAIPIPGTAQFFLVYTIGTGPFYLRTQLGSDILTNAPAANTMHAYATGSHVGPFPINLQGESTVVIARPAGSTMTSYFINWMKQ